MSAFIVDEKCLNNIINFLTYEQFWKDKTYGECSKLLKKRGYDLAKDNDCERLLQDMLNLNIQAWEIRYPDKVIYSEDCSFKHSSNPIWDIHPGIYQALKSIHCGSYQCMEGEPMESSMLYITFRKIINIINASIVKQMPQYQKAVWG